MAGWHHWLNGRESEWTPGVGDGQGGLACCSSWGRKESDMTEQLNWTECFIRVSLIKSSSHLIIIAWLVVSLFHLDYEFLKGRHRNILFISPVSRIGASWWLSSKESTCQCRRHKFDPWVGNIPWRRKWQLTPVFLLGEYYGQRSVTGYIVHGIFQARILEWVAIFFSRRSSRPRDQTLVSCIAGRFFTREPLGKPSYPQELPNASNQGITPMERVAKHIVTHHFWDAKE